MTPFKEIDMAAYARRGQFEYFQSLPDPHFGITVKVDVAPLIAYCKVRGVSFSLGAYHLLSLAANKVPELRRRVRGGGIVEYEYCMSSHIEPTDDGAYCYVPLRHDMSWEEYFPYAEAERTRQIAEPTLDDGEDAASLLFFSALPWLHYEQFSMPSVGHGTSNPRISFGKYEWDDMGRALMPVTLNVSHALADGLHAAQFFENVRLELERLKEGAV